MNINKRFGVQSGTNVKRLLTVLANTKLAAGKAEGVSWQSLYQTIFGLINNVGDVEDKTSAAITSIQNTISGGGGGGGGGTGIIGASYVTVNPEALLPNSKQLVAGDNIVITDLGAQLEIGAPDLNPPLDFVVMSDGGIPIPQPVNDGAGSFIYVPYAP